MLKLPCNSLRILPEELFSCRLTFLDLRNNLLAYIPRLPDSSPQNLKCLSLGNFKSLGDRCACCDGIGRRTTGNSFKTVPSAVLQFKQLKLLDLRSVGLGEFFEEEIYTALPNLASADLSHNNLLKKPNANFNNRQILIINHDNPDHGWVTLDHSIWNYRLTTYVRAPLFRAMLSTVNLGVRYYYISGPVFSLLFYKLYTGIPR